MWHSPDDNFIILKAKFIQRKSRRKLSQLGVKDWRCFIAIERPSSCWSTLWVNLSTQFYSKAYSVTSWNLRSLFTLLWAAALIAIIILSSSAMCKQMENKAFTEMQKASLEWRSRLLQFLRQFVLIGTEQQPQKLIEASYVLTKHCANIYSDHIHHHIIEKCFVSCIFAMRTTCEVQSIVDKSTLLAVK